MNPKAKRERILITGITGQDGSYLAELLIKKNYEVYGIVRRSSNDSLNHIEHLRLSGDVKIIHGDIRDTATIKRALAVSEPDEIYNLASQSHVGISFECPEETFAINFTAAQSLVHEALKLNKKVKIYQASSSEMFGDAPAPQTESTPFNPQSPYAKSKLAAYTMCRELREKEGAHICSGFLYNHESPRRSKNFVTRKISHSMAKIKLGLQQKLEVGNIYSARDWGYAEDYVYAMWLIMQQDKADDFVIATGVQHTVKDFINEAALHLDIKLRWSGNGAEEMAHDASGSTRITINPDFYRPVEPCNLVGDNSKAKEVLGWEPTVTFSELVALMVRHDLERIRKYGL